MGYTLREQCYSMAPKECKGQHFAGIMEYPKMMHDDIEDVDITAANDRTLYKGDLYGNTEGRKKNIKDRYVS